MSFLPDWLTGYDAANAQAAREKEAQYARDLEARGRSYVPPANDSWTPSEEAARNSITDAFQDGLNDGRRNTNNFIAGAISQVLKSVPVVVWLCLAVVVFYWMGGFTWLARRTKGKLA